MDKVVLRKKDASFHPFLHAGRIFARFVTGDKHGTVSEFSSDGQKIRTVIGDGAVPIRQIAVVNGRIYANQFDYHASGVSCCSLNGEAIGSVDAPEDGTIKLLPNRSTNARNLFYVFESFHQPPAIFEYDCLTGKSTLFHKRSAEVQSVRFKVSRLVFPANDGVEIPLTLVELDGRPANRQVPVILTAYGGFGAPMTPQFSVLATIMMEFGAVLAIAHVRGGGDFGMRWHEAGSRRNRQTGIDDLLAAVESMCSRGITTQKQVGAFGGSHAGLMLAAALMQRPSSFGAALCIAPLLDMVRYERFDLATKWRNEYGTTEDAEDFRALYSYSPYHHIEQDFNYPPTMFVTGDKDEACNPAHVRKMAARLLGRPTQKSPIIVDYSDERGHMPTLPLSVRVEALARRIAFLVKELNVAMPSGGHREAICY